MCSDPEPERRNGFDDASASRRHGSPAHAASPSSRRYGHEFALFGTATSISIIAILALFCQGGRYLDATSLPSRSAWEPATARHGESRQRSLQQRQSGDEPDTKPELSLPCEDIFRRPPPEVATQLPHDNSWTAHELSARQEKRRQRCVCQYAQNCEGDWPSTFLLPLILCNGVDMGARPALDGPEEAGDSYAADAESKTNNNAIQSLCVNLLLPPIILLYLYLLFRLLATTADSYFSPALETFSFELGLPPRFAGATLLALGNGSPDLGSTINSILLWNETTPAAATSSTADMLKNNKPAGWTLCLGSLTGGGMFVGTVVSGLVVRSCDGVPCRGAFLRDASMYALSVAAVWRVLESNRVTRRDARALLGIWFGYVSIVLAADLYHRKVTLRRLHLEGKMRRESLKAERARKLSLLEEEGGEDAGVADEQTPLVNKGPHRPTDGTNATDPKQSRLTTTDRFAMLMSNYDPASVKWHDLSSKSTVSDSDETSTMHNVIRQIHSIRRTSVAVPVNEDATVPVDGSLPEDDAPRVYQRLDSYPEELEEESAIYEGEQRSCSVGMLAEAYQEIVYQAGRYWEVHFVKEPSRFEKFGFVLELPITVLRTLTIPVPCEDHYNRIIVALSTMISPFWVLRYFDTDFTSLPATVFTFVAVMVAYAVLRFGSDEKLPLLAAAPLSLYGFFIAATWIDVIGNYLVSLLQFLGTICRIPAPILGVTVLAWGNSLGDLSANLAMARKGAPDMATTANFAGPSFNLLVGMGCGFLSLQRKLQSTSIFPVSLTKSIRIGFGFNIINCLLIIVCAICCQWRIPYRYSYVFFALYVTFVAMSLMTLVRN